MPHSLGGCASLLTRPPCGAEWLCVYQSLGCPSATSSNVPHMGGANIWAPSRCRCVIFASAVMFLLVHSFARGSLLFHRNAPCSLRVAVLSCKGAPHNRTSNAHDLVAKSPYAAQVVRCSRTPAPHQYAGIATAEANLFASHLHILSTGFSSWTSPRASKQNQTVATGAMDAKPAAQRCLLILEDDVLVDWAAIRRVVDEANRLRDPWHLISLYDGPPGKYDSLAGRLCYTNERCTDALLRFGCIHRLMAHKAYTGGIIYTEAAARQILSRAASEQWRVPFDIWLGTLNGSPFHRPERSLRIMRSGCTPQPLDHGQFSSTLAAARDAFHQNRTWG